MLKSYPFIVIILFVFITTNLHATQNTFGKAIDGMQFAMSGSPTSDGGMIISGASSASDSTIIVKTDNNGDEQWRKYFEGYGYSNGLDGNKSPDINQTDDGGYIFITTIELADKAVQINKLNTVGDIEWAKVYDNDGDDFSREVLYTVDKGYLFLYGNGQNTYIIKTDSLGNEQWTVIEYIGGFTVYDFQIRQTKDLGYIFSRKGYLIKYNVGGNEEWRQGPDGVLRDKVEELHSGGYVIVDTRRYGIERTDALGDTLWQIKKISRLDDFTIDKNDNIITAGEKLIKIDMDANILWEKPLPFQIIKDIYLEDDGNIVLVGKLQNNGGFTARYNSDGDAEYIILSRPEDGEVLSTDSKYTIQWASSGFGEVKIEWTNEFQNDWIVLAQLQDSLLSYEWNTPGSHSIANKIRISSLTNPTVYDENKTGFSVGAKHYDYIAINEIFMYFATDGNGSYDPFNAGAGFYWPGGQDATQAAVLEDGPLWGGLVNGDTLVNGSTYIQGLQPGNIISTGLAANVNDPDIGVYKVRPDWMLLPDSPFKQRLEYDWNHWPVHLGAPWIDEDGDGKYNPQIDQPDITGDEMNWMVMNDLDSVKTKSLYGADPIGIEVQLAIYGYNTSNDLKDVVFKRYKHINKSDNTVDSMYFAYWADVDLGDAGDDYVGTDTLLNMVYSFNGDENDGVYPGAPPAIGYVLLQGPIIAGEPEDSAYAFNAWHWGNKNLKMTSSMMFINGDPSYSDPPLGVIEGAQEFWNVLRGVIGDGSAKINPVTGKATPFVATGSPIKGTGWYEGEGEGAWGRWPGDRRQVLSSGPVTFAPGDSQEVVYAIIMARGDDRLDSITKLREKARSVREFYYTGILTSIEDKGSSVLPVKFSLSQNYPNPFNPETIINYELRIMNAVKLIVYDVLGREVKTLVNKTQQAGKYSVTFNAANLASGVYYYKLKAGTDFEKTRKMLLLR